ncbi:MAG: hypothetical protein KC731_22525 [Myxococcales bacterium]|nr:hypothetical protein [Myxococcales bacterium]
MPSPRPLLRAFLLAVIAWPTTATAAPPLREAAETYYDREDLYNGVYVGLGSVQTAAGIALITRPDPGLRAAGVAFTAVGGIQLLTGVIYLALNPGWRREALTTLASDEASFQNTERTRMATIESRFIYFKLAELTAIATGLVLGSVGAARDQPLLMGAGAGLGVAASGQLVMEHIVHDAARDYLFTLGGRF